MQAQRQNKHNISQNCQEKQLQPTCGDTTETSVFSSGKFEESRPEGDDKHLKAAKDALN